MTQMRTLIVEDGRPFAEDLRSQVKRNSVSRSLASHIRQMMRAQRLCLTTKPASFAHPAFSGTVWSLTPVRWSCVPHTRRQGFLRAKQARAEALAECQCVIWLL
jgi:hypothetical protein